MIIAMFSQVFTYIQAHQVACIKEVFDVSVSMKGATV
jgi:hypothetical protein